MILIADLDPQSWLAKEPTSRGPCVVRFTGKYSAYSAVDQMAGI